MVASVLPWQPVVDGDSVLARPIDRIAAGAGAAYGLPVAATLAAYRAAHPSASAGDLLATIQTDWYYLSNDAVLLSSQFVQQSFRLL
jgi:hypothetical protein